MARFLRPFFREEFDQRRDFVVRRSYTFNGRRYEPGHQLTLEEKVGYTPRRLRQLYDMRLLEYAPEISPPPLDLAKITVPVMRPRVEPEPPKPRARFRRSQEEGHMEG